MRILIMAVMSLIITGCQHQAADSTPTPKEPVAMKACAKDLKVCEDGQSVGRDAKNQCEFFECPAPRKITACPEDMKQCPDGSFVFRDQTKNCEFKPCPDKTDDTSSKPNKETKEPMMCTQEVKQCPDGSYVGRDSKNSCAFKPCPQESN